jgi:hypothetical protein
MSVRADLTLLPAAVAGAAERLGALTATRLGRSGDTFLLRTDGGQVVVKRMEDGRAPAMVRAVLDRLAREPAPVCPGLIDAVPAHGCWYGIFEYVEEVQGHGAADLDAVLDLLDRLGHAPIVPDWALEPLWLVRLRDGLAGEPHAERLLDDLESDMPRGPRVLAHGDFNLPNVVMSASGPVLVDWEEWGSAACGFDAGWLLALARARAGLPWSHAALERALASAGFPRSNLCWFERLGVLRLLYRARTLAMPQQVRPRILTAIRRTLADVA